jgi:hypothetical protein
LSNRRGNALAKFQIKFNGSNPIFVGKHELPLDK